MNKYTILLIFAFSILILTGCNYNKHRDSQIENSEIRNKESNYTPNNRMSTDYIIGKWQSIEKDHLGTIEVQKASKENEIYLILNNESKIQLTLEESDSKEQLIFLNSDKTLKYVFSAYGENQLLFYKNTMDEQSEGISRSWILERKI